MKKSVFLKRQDVRVAKRKLIVYRKNGSMGIVSVTMQKIRPGLGSAVDAARVLTESMTHLVWLCSIAWR